MQIIGYVLLMLIQGSAVPVSEQIYTQQECESRAWQVMQVEFICNDEMKKNEKNRQLRRYEFKQKKSIVN
ncbi:hypothetical protein [Providencia rettgeri]|uniref:hypothetical protein n=1 Tax=Providencia rettgeri TaxID=587 RepID=UPI00235ED41E|nr:hypothetical protein [Providencia rettgeri]